MTFYPEDNEVEGVSFIPGIYFTGTLKKAVEEFGSINPELVYGTASATDMIPQGYNKSILLCDVKLGKSSYSAILATYHKRTIKGIIFASNDQLSAALAKNLLSEKPNALYQKKIKKVLENAYV